LPGIERDFLTYIAPLTTSSKNRHFWKRKSDLQSIKSIFQSKSCGGFTLFMQFHPSLLKHIAPIHWGHINLTGDYDWKQHRRIEKGGFRKLNPIPKA